ncbi:MAG: alpha/beta hydrolase [Thermocrispum sp.]
MPIDPQLAQLLQHAPPLSHEGETPQQARERFSYLAANPALAELVRPVAGLEDIEVDGAEGRLPARVYRPDGAGPHATVAFFHGGGFVLGGIDTHDGFCRELCQQTGAVVVSVGYRLAPEHPFPAGVQDCVAATRWVAGHVAELGGDPRRLGLAGDSAGGSLAAVAAQELATRPAAVPVTAQLLIYPATDFGQDYPSRKQFAAGAYLDQRALDMIARAYVVDRTVLSDPRMSPRRFERLDLLPPTVLVTAEYDPIRDQGEAYADALEAAGVPVTRQRLTGLVHGFAQFGPYVPAAQQGIDTLCALFDGVLNDDR